MKPKHASFVALAILAALVSGCEKPATAVKGTMIAMVDGDKLGEAELNPSVSGTYARSAEAKSGSEITADNTVKQEPQ